MCKHLAREPRRPLSKPLLADKLDGSKFAGKTGRRYENVRVLVKSSV